MRRARERESERARRVRRARRSRRARERERARKARRAKRARERESERASQLEGESNPNILLSRPGPGSERRTVAAVETLGKMVSIRRMLV